MYRSQGYLRSPVSTQTYARGKHCLVVLRDDGMVMLEVYYYRMNIDTRKTSTHVTRRDKDGDKLKIMLTGAIGFDGTIEQFRAMPVRCDKVEEYIKGAKLYELNPNTGEYYYGIPIDELEDLTHEDFKFIR